MNGTLLGRETILQALRQALEPLDYVHAMWEGGAAAFKRADDWSDIDLQVDADDDRSADVVAVVEETLSALSPIELRYELPQPTWHGHWQAFYRLRDTSPFLMMDFVVIRHSSAEKFLQPEIHGEARVHFDKSGVVQTPPFDADGLIDRLRGRLETLRVTFDLFQIMTLKELHRGNDMEAISFYQSFTLRPLVEVLRIKYSPARYNFHTRYLYYELPGEVVRALEPLFFIANRDELAARREEAERWFHKAMDQIDLEEVRATLALGQS